ncbi:hypothetical protein PV05_10820 [Exophiala xenobiotica]|uniref:Heterokaryon incompatibility domain-containing protein n=1 Tax=Exophiala xenobiotica TaxID=348802 RepID=A0A0D2EMN0_9EURO|nr:uncharacterized protein PV05_10820 [Exophiala xenobiotica]KIW49109.1 hypothetical protein PV05_10820 [Exophiala xenobiotica]
MTAIPQPRPDDLDSNITGTTDTTEPAWTAVSARRQEVSEILRQNYIGAQRSRLGSLNEFRHWTPQEVKDLFDQNMPPIVRGKSDGSRKLYPLGPIYRSIPTDSRRWKQLAAKTAMVGAVDALAIPFSPLLMLANKEDRKKTLKWMSDLNVEALSSSFFVKPDPALVQQAANTGKALCVNRWGVFRVLDSGYAAISHVWAETMGLEYNDEKTEQDERGFNMHHFIRVMDVARKTGSEWFWFDLLAIPKGQDLATKTLKTRLINSLRHVYANAESIIVLDGLTVQLKSRDPLITAAILSCSRWLTRVWTYQEAKLAHKLKIPTATSVVDFEDMVMALREADARDSSRWHELYLTFYRLTPLHDRGISLADIAMSCDHRSCENDIDYARGFFALLGLEWKQEYTYEEGMLAILRSRPQHAARIAGMHGPRGLPAPYSWAPKYLARLQGRIYSGFDAQMGSLIGYWHTITVKRVLSKGISETHEKVFVCNLVVTPTPTTTITTTSSSSSEGSSGEENSSTIQIQFFPDHWTSTLQDWVESVIPSGKARLLCGEKMDFSNDETDQHARIVLAARDATGPLPDLNLDAWGDVAGSAVVNSPRIGVEVRRMRWYLD